MAQQKWIQLVAMMIQVQSLALFIGLRVWPCCELWCRLVATAPIWPLAGQPTYVGCSPKKKKKKNYSLFWGHIKLKNFVPCRFENLLILPLPFWKVWLGIEIYEKSFVLNIVKAPLVDFCVLCVLVWIFHLSSDSFNWKVMGLFNSGTFISWHFLGTLSKISTPCS